MNSREYYVYIMTSPHNTAIYVGVTNDLLRRVIEHKQKVTKGFTEKYNISKLVYYEEYEYIQDALDREKQLKGWLRTRKDKLIESINPGWKDLTEELY